MFYVYLIRSIKYPDQTYTGYTTNLKECLADHNGRESVYTVHGAPWELVTFTAFKDKYKALEFEKYLKSHAGRVFAQKRFW
jgi:putative endonuclease